MAPATNASTINFINSYYEQRTSGLEFLEKPDDSEQLEIRVKDIEVDDEKNKHEKAFLYSGGPEVLLKRRKKETKPDNQEQEQEQDQNQEQDASPPS